MASQTIEHNRSVISDQSAGYDGGRGRWFEFDRIRMAGEIESMVSRIPRATGELRAIDLGCGTGHASLVLAACGVTHLTIVDFVQDFVAQTRAKLADLKPLELESHCGDIASFLDRSGPRAYDIVCLCNSLQFCPDHEQVVQTALADLVKPSGFLYITGSRTQTKGAACLWELLHSALDYKLYRWLTAYHPPHAATDSVKYDLNDGRLAEMLTQHNCAVDIRRYRTFHTSLFNALARITRPNAFFSLMAQRAPQ